MRSVKKESSNTCKDVTGQEEGFWTQHGEGYRYELVSNPPPTNVFMLAFVCLGFFAAVCVRVCLHVHMSWYVRMRVCVRAWVCLCMRVCVTCMGMFVHAHCICMRSCMYARVHVHEFVYVHVRVRVECACACIICMCTCLHFMHLRVCAFL